MTEKELIREIAKIIKSTERKVKELYDEGTLEKPIANDIVLAERNMSYHRIKQQIKKYKQEKEK